MSLQDEDGGPRFEGERWHQLRDACWKLRREMQRLSEATGVPMPDPVPDEVWIDDPAEALATEEEFLADFLTQLRVKLVGETE